MSVVCNVCHDSMQIKVFLTACYHFICAECASKAATAELGGTICPFCTVNLRDCDIQELYLGLPVQPSSGKLINSVMFETCFASNCDASTTPSWPIVIKRTSEVMQSISELTKLINVQLLLSANQASIKSMELSSELEKQQAENLQLTRKLVQLQRTVDSTTRELQHKLFRKDEELDEIKAAFIQKMRRVDALEAHTATTTAATTTVATIIHQQTAPDPVRQNQNTFFGSLNKGHFFSKSSN